MSRAGIPRDVCLVLGRAMLWRMFDSSGDDLVPAEQKTRIMARYEDLGDRNTLAAGRNPIRKCPLVVGGFDTEVIIEKFDVQDGDGGEVNTRSMGLRVQELRLVASQLYHLRRDFANFRADHDRQMQVSKTLNDIIFLFSIIHILNSYACCYLFRWLGHKWHV
jgi:hypothetical protein